MDRERYPGERWGLHIFLSGLLPEVERALGRDALLYHRIRRALARGDLASLRDARRAFNHQPRALRRRLFDALCAAGAPAPTRAELLARYDRREPRLFVRFAGDAQAGGEPPMAVGLDHELLDPVPVQVFVAPGSLPSAVAATLRRIARRIEADRRLLSSRHWHALPAGPEPSGTDSLDRR